MATYHSADARAALMSQWTNLQAGTRATSSAPQSGGDKGESEVFGAFAARGRTIYNADAAYPLAETKGGDETGRRGTLGELERIEEAAARRHWDQFLMAARGDVEEEEEAEGLSPSPMSSRETTPTDAGAGPELTAEEMFARYMENNYY